MYIQSPAGILESDLLILHYSALTLPRGFWNVKKKKREEIENMKLKEKSYCFML